MKKSIKILFWVIFIFVFGMIGSAIFQSYILPKASVSPIFSKFGLFKKASENVTIVNKTEQVTVQENDSVNKIASQASATVVNIISIPEKEKSPLNFFQGAKNGTGVIMASDGLIATYRTALIETGARYKIMLFNGSSFDANLIGIDEFTNLAFLKIETSNLSVVPFANSEDFFPGKRLIAIGNSFEDYQNRYSSGLLSNIDKTFNIGGKTLSESEKLEGIFETDFLDQKEYIGGPVIDYNGELVGIIGSLSIDNQEKFFQIPSNIIKASMELAIKGNLKDRPYLGLYYVPITKSYAIAHNLNRDRGALVYSQQGLPFISGSPAEKSGLKLNDIIISISGKEINLDNSFSNILNQFRKGDSTEFLVLRDGQEIKLPVKL